MTTPRTRRWTIPSFFSIEVLLASFSVVLVCFGTGGFLLLVTGHDPIVLAQEWAMRGIGRWAGIEQSMIRATPLLILAVAVVIAMRAGTWNIGVDGQVLVGALAAATVAAHVSSMPAPFMWMLSFGAAIAGGAFWIVVPALLRAWWGINEIVTTLMFNYLGATVVIWAVKGALRDASVVSPQTPIIPIARRLPLLDDTRLHAGILLAIVLVVAVAAIVRWSVTGYELTIVGRNRETARHAAISTRWYIAGAMVVSGALAGVAGANDILSTKGTFQAEWNPQYGLVAFAVVFLARRSFVGLLPAALLLGQLSYIADILPRAADISPAFMSFVEGVMLVVLACTSARSSRANAGNRGDL